MPTYLPPYLSTCIPPYPTLSYPTMHAAYRLHARLPFGGRGGEVGWDVGWLVGLNE